MKNILVIATYFPPMGGVGTVRVKKFVKYLNNYDWQPTVITVNEKFLKNIDENLMEEIPKNVDVKRIDFNSNKPDISFDFCKALKKQLQKIITEKKYNCVFVTGGPFYIIPIAKYIYKKYKIPYIIDLRDPWKLQLIDNSTLYSKVKGNIKKYVKGLYEKSCFKYASAICTVNDTMTNEYKLEYKKYADKFYTISNGYDLDDYKSIKAKKLDGVNITYTGKFETSAGFRNPKILFKALAKINSNRKQKINFIHVGEKEKIVSEIAEEEKCIDFCKFVGFKKFDEAISYCKGSDILIAICGKQKIEQTGKIFDYVCCNRPIIVVSTGKSEIDEVCKKFKNIYHVKHDDYESMIKTILKIIDEKVKMETNNLENNDYSRYALTGQLVKILNKLGD